MLAKLPKSQSAVHKATAERVKTNWGSMLKQIRRLDFKKDYTTIKSRVLVIIKHMFDNHEHCNVSWCPYLKALKEKKTYKPDETKPMYDKKNDAKQYEQLCHAVARFQTDENIQECLHNYDAQLNESLNMSVSRFVPKFLNFGTNLETLIFKLSLS